MYYIYVMLNHPKCYLGELHTERKKTIEECDQVHVDNNDYRILHKRKVGEDSYIFIVEAI